jgi:anthranilate phosphoribosyltransferase
MPVDPAEEVLADLVAHKYPVSAELWGNFWDRLRAKELRDGEALALCTTLSVHLPDGESVANLLSSLRERNPQPDPPTKPTVNIVGTGGGPSTFNLSTASAFVAGALGARVIKTGSRAYASKTGSASSRRRPTRRPTSCSTPTGWRAPARSSTRRSCACSRGRSCRSA